MCEEENLRLKVDLDDAIETIKSLQRQIEYTKVPMVEFGCKAEKAENVRLEKELESARQEIGHLRDKNKKLRDRCDQRDRDFTTRDTDRMFEVREAKEELEEAQERIESLQEDLEEDSGRLAEAEDKINVLQDDKKRLTEGLLRAEEDLRTLRQVRESVSKEEYNLLNGLYNDVTKYCEDMQNTYFNEKGFSQEALIYFSGFYTARFEGRLKRLADIS